MSEPMIRNHGEARRAIRRCALPRSTLNVRLRVADDLEIRFTVPERDTGEPITLLHRRRLQLPCTVEAFFDKVREVVHYAYRHEADEVLLIDGDRRFDPEHEHEPTRTAP